MVQGIEFEEYRPSYSTSYGSQDSGLTGWIMKHFSGFIKSKKQAEVFLLCFVVVAFVITFILLFGGGKTETKIPTGYKMVTPSSGPPYLEKIY